MKRCGVWALVVVAIFAGACRSSDDAAVKLDGSPRVSDAQGVITKATPTMIELDGKRYSVDKEAVVFSTYNRQMIGLSRAVGDYVHVGLDGEKVAWVARVGRVLRTDPAKPVVIYQGTLKRVAGARLDFIDGTVLTLAKGLKVPSSRTTRVTDVVINVTSDRVQGLTLPPDKSTASTQAP
ncbi:MAG TPA: hypothetical protein VNB24_04965 [Acidimicrobiales bacterium]|nr:hypothetical protein [Acidimicrobiales bacterium]